MDLLVVAGLQVGLRPLPRGVVCPPSSVLEDHVCNQIVANGCHVDGILRCLELVKLSWFGMAGKTPICPDTWPHGTVALPKGRVIQGTGSCN